MRFLNFIYVFFSLPSIFSTAYCVGLNRSCGNNIRVSILTKSLSRGGATFYDVADNSVLFVDGPAATVYKYFIDSQQYYSVRFEGNKSVNVILPIEGARDTFLTSYGNDLAILKWKIQDGSASFQVLDKRAPCHQRSNTYLNDAKVGRTRTKPVFFFTTPIVSKYGGYDRVPPYRSALFDIANGKKKLQIPELDYSKGLGFSLDGTVIFLADAKLNRTFCASYNEKRNAIENVKLLLNYPDLGIEGHPHSIAVDAEGYVWIPNQAYRLLKLNPYNGRVECSIKLPAKTVSTLAFGRCPRTKNYNLDCMYVNTYFGDDAPSTPWNGPLLLVEGVGSAGVLENKVPWSTIFG